MAQDKETGKKEQTRPYRSTSASRTPYTKGVDRGSSALTPRETTSPDYGLSRSPFSMMRRLAEDMDRIFYDFGFGPSLIGSDMWTEPVGTGELWTPEIETFRRGDKLVVRADLPGLQKENVNVEIDEDTLTISGQRQDEFKEERDDYYRSERRYGRFFRAIPLPQGVDENQIDAKFSNGVLEVTLPAPKEPTHERKRINID
jgi:HSP20 family protein